ncbi:hypothetical protein KJS94_03425 [Flavihumibacter rivuli]|uniref:hypothetical protein n=1 Tax=Flavihumibacter rivuli TaxID=2838156 RepID=UPI001BDECD43|nr:hypothetical protein [Flavihumibacter rivuli]ULQ57249.1 hypothetical protein KJS94_03425 [Flavihumibacter rivuli]
MRSRKFFGEKRGGTTKLLYSLGVILLFSGMITLGPSCAKEYSIEGRDTADGPLRPDSTIQVDTSTTEDSLPAQLLVIPSCSVCDSTKPMELQQWRFKVGNSWLCGPITRAIISPEKDAMTFFGPSACSPDSGAVFTAYLDGDKLDRDRQNLQIYKVSFYYYDNYGTDRLLKSYMPHPFFLQIDRYDHASAIAHGRFSGFCYTPKGDSVLVSDGAFSIRFN